MKIDIRNYSKVWVGTDFHDQHDRTFIWGARGFSSAKAHSDALNGELESKLTKDCLLIYLGDLCLNCTDKYALDLLFKLRKGSLMYLMGNHDQRVMRIRQNKLIDGVVWLPSLTEATFIFEDGKKQAATLTHFPQQEWNHMNHGAWSLFGHVHGNYGGPSDMSHGKRLNPSYDLMGKFLVPLEEIKALLDYKEANIKHHE